MDQLEQIRLRQLEIIADRERVYQINAGLAKDVAAAQLQIEKLNSELERMKAELAIEKTLRLELERSRSLKIVKRFRLWTARFRRQTNP